MTDLKAAIAHELYRALERFGAKSDLLGIVGSYGDTLPDADVLCGIRTWNDTVVELPQPWRSDMENAPRLNEKGQMVEIMIAGGTYYDSMSTFSDPMPFDGWTLACWDGREWRGENSGGHDEFYYHKPTHWMPKIATPAQPSAEG